ncbi:MAG: magnesium transporter [Flavobacteriales bacterium]
MQFELTKKFIEELSQAIAEGNDSFLLEKLEPLHPADIAEILENTPTQEARYIYNQLEEELASDVLVEMDEDFRERFLELFTEEEIAEQVDYMDTDDAADVIQYLSDERKERVLSHIEDAAQASDIIDLLNYEEDTAGSIMAKEFIKVNENWSVAVSIREMRKQAQEIEHVYNIYVVNDLNILLGTLSLKSLLYASPRQLIKELYSPTVRSVKTTDSTEYVANLMEKYDYVAVPVVNEEGVLLGRITIDDVVDVIKEEAEKDYQMASGISESVESSDSVITLSRARLPWLLIGMTGGILGSQIIGGFETQIQLYPKMAAFIPLVAATAGNVGVQAAAIVVQAIANNTIHAQTTSNKLMKELGVAALNGVACALIIFFYNMMMGEPVKLALTVSVALISVITFAGVFGTLIPLLLNSRKIDPAVATGPFITTMNDIFGLLQYFFIGWLIYF